MHQSFENANRMVDMANAREWLEGYDQGKTDGMAWERKVWVGMIMAIPGAREYWERRMGGRYREFSADDAASMVASLLGDLYGEGEMRNDRGPEDSSQDTGDDSQGPPA